MRFVSCVVTTRYVKRMVADGERYRMNHVEVLTQRLVDVEMELEQKRAREETLIADIRNAEEIIHDMRDQMHGVGWDDPGDSPRFGIFKTEKIMPKTPREGVPRGYRSVQGTLRICNEELPKVQTDIRYLASEVCFGDSERELELRMGTRYSRTPCGCAVVSLPRRCL